MTDGSYAHGDIRQLLGCQCQKEIEVLRYRLQQAEQERDERKKRNEKDSRLLKKWRKRTIQADRLNIRAMRAEKERGAAMEANTAMREDIQQLIVDYERRLKSVKELIENPSSDAQQVSAAAKGSAYSVIKRELESILSRYPMEGGEPDAAPTV